MNDISKATSEPPIIADSGDGGGSGDPIGVPAAVAASVADGSSEPVVQREELTEFLRSKLIECGWRDQVANMCRNLIQKHGVEHIKLAQIVSEVRDEARQKVPEQVKAELLTRIRKLNQGIQAPE